MSGWKIEDLPPEGVAYVTALHNCLALYLPFKNDHIEFMIGFNVKAIIRIEGGNLTKPLLAEIIANLNRYKKYYPEKIEEDSQLTLPQLIGKFESALAEHRAALAAPEAGAT